MAGIVCGAYSSVCITGPVWYYMKKREKGKRKAVSSKSGVDVSKGLIGNRKEKKAAKRTGKRQKRR